jgi:hypothetical protein
MLNYPTFESMYHRYQSSGLKVRDFCSNEGIHETTFYYWVRKIKKRPLPPADFIPLVVENKPSPPSSSLNSVVLPNPGIVPKELYMEISLPGGVCVKLKGEFTPDYLQTIINLISR